MASPFRMSNLRGVRRGWQLRPCLARLEQRLVPTMAFPGIAGDPSIDRIQLNPLISHRRKSRQPKGGPGTGGTGDRRQ
jgi:hypothetical protein